jgi:hypothetical protein
MVVAFYSLHCAQTPEEFPLGLGEFRLLRQRRLRPLPGLTPDNAGFLQPQFTRAAGW